MKLTEKKNTSGDDYADKFYNVKTFYRSIFSIAEAAKNHGLVIYGAGHWGHASLEIFKLFNIIPLCFCDDDENKIGKTFHDIVVLSLDEAAEKYKGAIFVVGAINEGCIYRPVMQKRLKERSLSSEFSGFLPLRYLFLLNGAMDKISQPPIVLENGYDREPDNIIIFNHGGNTGHTFFHTLIDGHPNILTIPHSANMGTREWKTVYLNRIRYLEGKDLIIEIAAQLCHYYNSRFLTQDCKEGITYYNKNINGSANEAMFVDSNKVVSFISSVLKEKNTISFVEFVKILNLSYNYAADKKVSNNQPLYIFYNLHDMNFDFKFFDGLLSPSDFKRIEYWFIFREPINHVNSAIRLVCDKDSLVNTTAGKTHVVNNDAVITPVLTVDTGYFQRETSDNTSKVVKIIRFEDVKKNTDGFMRSICKWLGIKYDNIMVTATVNGIETYFPKRNNTGLMKASDMSPLEKNDYSKYLSEFDIFRFKLVYQDFMKAYGYECDVPDYKLFSNEFLKELYGVPFKFEETLNELANEYLQKGIIDKIPDYHNHFVGFWLDFMQNGHTRLVGDLFRPVTEENDI